MQQQEGCIGGPSTTTSFQLSSLSCSEIDSQSQEEIQARIMREPYYVPRHAELQKAFFTADVDRAKWHQYCAASEEYPVYECWNVEYVERLCEYLLERAHAYNLKSICILEVGAGNGKLTGLLNQYFSEKHNNSVNSAGEAISFHCEAADSGKRKMKKLYDVREVDYRTALHQNEWDIIICSWMPFAEDWTGDFRQQASVKEYLLIGHAGDGLNGHPLLTWGYKKAGMDDDDGEDEDDDEDDGSALGSSTEAAVDGKNSERKKRRRVEYSSEPSSSSSSSLVSLLPCESEEKDQQANEDDDDDEEDNDDADDDDYDGYIDVKRRLYVKEGFERVDLPHLSRWQVCRFDDDGGGGDDNLCTITTWPSSASSSSILSSRQPAAGSSSCSRTTSFRRQR